MTLKEALRKKRKTTSKPQKSGRKQQSANTNDKYYRVVFNLETVEQVSVIEFVKASSPEEAQKAASKQFRKRTPKFVHNRANRPWNRYKVFSIQNLQLGEVQTRNRFALSELQQKVLKLLKDGHYLEPSYSDRWHLVNPNKKDQWGNTEKMAVASISVDSLFQKGLLTPLATVNMSDQEIEVQEALGSTPETDAYTIDMKTIEKLGFKL